MENNELNATLLNLQGAKELLATNDEDINMLYEEAKATMEGDSSDVGETLLRWAMFGLDLVKMFRGGI